MSVAGALTLGTTAVNLGKKLIPGISSIFGGGGQSKSCKQKQNEVASTFRSLFTQSELNELSAELDRLESSDHGSTPEGLAYEYIGGKNCKVENQGKRAWVQYVNQRVSKKEYQLKKQQAEKLETNILSQKYGGTVNGMNTGFSLQNPFVIMGAIAIAIVTFFLSKQ